MSKCTASEAVKAFEYWLGYCEKATSAYATTRDKSAFEKNKGANNWTYAGHICGINGPAGAWCAMQVSLAIYEACGNSKTDAKEVMHGVWPYTACDQLYDKAPASMKGRRGAWTPKPGDVIVFSDNGSTRTHTGMVYAADKNYVYTYEGNSSNMCRKRSYLRTSAYIWGYVRPAYAAAATGVEAESVSGDQYGGAVSVSLHQLSKGCAGAEVKTVQRILYAYGYKGANGKVISVDGDFGANTQYAVKTMQAKLKVTADGVVGQKTWAAMLTQLW